MIPHNRWTNRPEYEAAALRVLRSGHVAQGREVEAFESELAQRFRPNGWACCVSSGTAALRLALGFLGHDSIWIPTYACASLWFAPLHGINGQHVKPEPQLRDCDQDLNTPKATIVVHTYGLLSHVEPNTIEDFTHAPGIYGAGSRGLFSVISFGATKPLGIGAGGALLGPSAPIREARALRDGDAWPGLRSGSFNYQMSDVHAAIGRERLKRIDEDNAWRWRTALRYSNAIPAGIVGPSGGVVHSRYRFVLRLQNADHRQRAEEHFMSRGIETINPLRPDELLHRRLGFPASHFPNAEAAAQRTLSLPIWPGMTEDEVQLVEEAIGALA